MSYQSIRKKQQQDVLDYDLNMNRQVVNLLKKQANIFNDEIKPPGVVDAVKVDKLLSIIDELGEDFLIMVQSGNRSSDQIKQYNQIMMMRRQILSTNPNSKSIIDSKIQSLLPLLNSIVISILEHVEHFFDGENDGTDADIAKQYVDSSIFSLMRDNIANENYRTIGFDELNIEFNRIVNNLPGEIKYIVMEGMKKASLGKTKSMTEKNIGKEVDKLIKEREREFGHKLSQGDRIALEKILLDKYRRDIPAYNQLKPFISTENFQSLVQSDEIHDNNDGEGTESMFTINDDDDGLFDFEDDEDDGDDGDDGDDSIEGQGMYPTGKSDILKAKPLNAFEAQKSTQQEMHWRDDRNDSYYNLQPKTQLRRF